MRNAGCIALISIFSLGFFPSRIRIDLIADGRFVEKVRDARDDPRDMETGSNECDFLE